MSCVEVFFRQSWGSVRRNPSTNHWAKWGNNNVDFGEGLSPVSVRRNRSRREQGPEAAPAARGPAADGAHSMIDRQGPAKSDSRCKCSGAEDAAASCRSVLLMSHRFTTERTFDFRPRKSQTGPKFVVANMRAPFLSPFFRQNPLVTGRPYGKISPASWRLPRRVPADADGQDSGSCRRWTVRRPPRWRGRSPSRSR